MLLRTGKTNLPAPTSMTVNDEIIWSEDTGRTLNGTMVGEAIAEKKTIGLKWEWLTEDEVKLLKNSLVIGFFPLTFHDAGKDHTLTTYRGTLSKEHAWEISGVYYYKSVSVDIVQR
jgi:hypothetical protein